MINWLIELRSRSTAVRVAALATVMLLAFATAAPFSVRLGGSEGLAAASVSAFLCWTGATSALAIGGMLRGPQFALFTLLTGMFVRMGIPLAFGAAIHLRGGPLADAGFLYYLLFFYLVSLAAETMLSLPVSQRSPDGPSPAKI